MKRRKRRINIQKEVVFVGEDAKKKNRPVKGVRKEESMTSPENIKNPPGYPQKKTNHFG